MKKYYNFDTMFITLRDAIREFLKANNIYYELSKNYDYYHFEILLNSDEFILVNNFLDTQIITEVE